jgi:FkbM family methyltransferase
MLFDLLRFAARLLPPRVPELIYTLLLRPGPLRRVAHRTLLSLIPTEIQVDGLTLFLNPRDPVLSSAVALGIYENYERDLFRRVCKPGATVVDIGANIGLYTAIAAARVGKSGKVIAIEPHAESYGCLQKLIRHNDLTQVSSFNLAAGDCKRSVTLFVTDDNKADSRIYDDTGTRAKTVTEMIDLDHLLSENRISNVNVIKMDIQGAEALALKGMNRTLAENPDLVIFAEFWPWGIEQTGSSASGFLRDLRKGGFVFKAIEEDRRRVIDVEDVDELIARHENLQYTGATLRRSHANLICVRDTYEFIL